MTYVLLFILALIIGVLLVPIVIYLRATNTGWDDSNIFNEYRELHHIALHPNDFVKMQ